MDVIDAIETRRSVRGFSERDVPRDVLAGVLEAGLRAPSPKGARPWVIDLLDRRASSEVAGLLRTWCERHADGPLEGTSWDSLYGTIGALQSASATVFLSVRGGSVPVRREGIPAVLSVGMCAQNMMLAARSAGVASLPICDFYCARDEVRRYLGREEPVLLGVALGYPRRVDAFASVRLDASELSGLVTVHSGGNRCAATDIWLHGRELTSKTLLATKEQRDEG